MLISCIAWTCSRCATCCIHVSRRTRAVALSTRVREVCVSNSLLFDSYFWVNERSLFCQLCVTTLFVFTVSECLHARTFVRRKPSNHICGFHIHSQARSSCRRLYMYMCNVCVCDLLSFRFTETFLRCDNGVSQSQRVIRLPRSPDATFLLTLSC